MSPIPILVAAPVIVLLGAFTHAADPPQAPRQTRTVPIRFDTHDGHPMSGKLTLPGSNGPHPVVIYVQTAEGMTVDMKRLRPGGGTFNYFDLYRDQLPAMNVAFFSYEGRGIRNGAAPPRYEQIDWDVYNTSTLENKVRDLLSAIDAVRKQPAIDASRIFLMGASEGTLLAAEAAARAPSRVRGLILYGVMSETMRVTFSFIVSDGAFMAYRGFFDTDRDGKISRAEFEADTKKYRLHVFKNAGFEHFDKDNDGFFTAGEVRVLSKRYLDAIEKDDFAVLDQWAKTAAGVATPSGWFKDHFSHQPIWTFLSKLDVEVGCFHGTADTATSVESLRKLEEQAKKAGKSNIEFHYFDDLDHTLNVGTYFVNGSLPAGHRAIMEYIRVQTAKR